MAKSLARTVALAAAVPLLLGPGCRSGTPTEAEDKAAAERIILTSADLPGFVREPDDDDSSASSIRQCVNNNPLLAAEDKPRGADSADFTRDDGNVRVQSGAFFAEKEAEARQAFSELEGALTSQCLKDGLKATMQESSDPSLLVVGDVSASPLPALRIADEFAASRLTVPLQAVGNELSVYVDMTFLRQGRALAGLFTFQAGSPFPDSERTRLATLLGKRMRGKARNTADATPVPTTATTAVSSPTTAVVTATDYTTFRDPSGLTLEHPRTWTVEPSGGSFPLVLFLDPAGGVPFRRNVNIMVQSGARPITFDQYTQLSLKQISDIRGSSTEDSRPTTLSGTPAHRVAYRGDLGKGELRFLAVWTVRGGKAWLVTYTADPARYDTGLPEVERLLTTIQLPE